jgi:ubiquinone/menaquinone biosynthesis C-methylase UbiE
MSVDYDQLAQLYARHRQVHPDVPAHLIDIARLGPTSSVLEVGCGTGNYITALVAATGCAGWGIDPSPQMLAQAQAQAPHLHFRQGHAAQVDFPAETFDLVFSVDVIHHVQDRAAYFGEAYRVLKPGGRVCTVTDSAEIIRTRCPLAVYFPETVEVELRRYPAVAELRELSAQAGFGMFAETAVEFAATITDLRPYQNRTYSCLHLISDEAFARGMQRLETDAAQGPIPWVSRYLLLWGTKPPRPGLP